MLQDVANLCDHACPSTRRESRHSRTRSCRITVPPELHRAGKEDLEPVHRLLLGIGGGLVARLLRTLSRYGRALAAVRGDRSGGGDGGGNCRSRMRRRHQPQVDAHQCPDEGSLVIVRTCPRPDEREVTIVRDRTHVPAGGGEVRTRLRRWQQSGGQSCCPRRWGCWSPGPAQCYSKRWVGRTPTWAGGDAVGGTTPGARGGRYRSCPMIATSRSYARSTQSGRWSGWAGIWMVCDRCA